MGGLYDKLIAYSNSDYYGFHMPGHKRHSAGEDDGPSCRLPYEIDITEIEGFDDLHHPRGILKEVQERSARVFGADETHFLVNGSTAGILSAVCGSTKKGDTVLVARNCHKSVYHAIYLNELKPVYLYPGFDEDLLLNTEIDPQDVKDALERNKEIRAVIIVSPTYDGAVSDVEEIAKIVHEKGLPLIVDEAHGAHLGFHPFFFPNSNKRGADIVIHSVHKTLPSLTQTALLHINGTLADRKKIRKYLDMLQSSSPSYILMASIDRCVRLLEKKGGAMFSSYVEELLCIRRKLSALKHMQLADKENFDKSRLVISVKDADITARELYNRLLSEYHLQMEMAAGTYVLAMTTVGDTKEGMERLTNALLSIDNKIGFRKEETALPLRNGIPRLKAVYTPSEADRLADTGGEDNRTESLPWEESAGYISAEYAYLYPPGIPVVVPGERMTGEAAELLIWYDRQGFSVEGLKREGYIEVFING